MKLIDFCYEMAGLMPGGISRSLTLRIVNDSICNVNLPYAVTLGGTCDKGGTSPVVLQGHVIYWW